MTRPRRLSASFEEKPYQDYMEHIGLCVVLCSQLQQELIVKIDAKIRNRAQKKQNGAQEEQSFDGLSSLLILPVQRAPRHQLLLASMCDTFPKPQPQETERELYDSLIKSLSRVKSLCSIINEKMKAFDGNPIRIDELSDAAVGPQDKIIALKRILNAGLNSAAEPTDPEVSKAILNTMLRRAYPEYFTSAAAVAQNPPINMGNLDPSTFQYQALMQCYKDTNTPLWLVLISTMPVGQGITLVQKTRAYINIATAFYRKALGDTDKHKGAFAIAQVALKIINEFGRKSLTGSELDDFRVAQARVGEAFTPTSKRGLLRADAERLAIQGLFGDWMVLKNPLCRSALDSLSSPESSRSLSPSAASTTGASSSERSSSQASLPYSSSSDSVEDSDSDPDDDPFVQALPSDILALNDPWADVDKPVDSYRLNRHSIITPLSGFPSPLILSRRTIGNVVHIDLTSEWFSQCLATSAHDHSALAMAQSAFLRFISQLKRPCFVTLRSESAAKALVRLAVVPESGTGVLRVFSSRHPFLAMKEKKSVGVATGVVQEEEPHPIQAASAENSQQISFSDYCDGFKSQFTGTNSDGVKHMIKKMDELASNKDTDNNKFNALRNKMIEIATKRINSSWSRSSVFGKGRELRVSALYKELITMQQLPVFVGKAEEKLSFIAFCIQFGRIFNNTNSAGVKQMMLCLDGLLKNARLSDAQKFESLGNAMVAIQAQRKDRKLSMSSLFGKGREPKVAALYAILATEGFSLSYQAVSNIMDIKGDSSNPPAASRLGQ